MASDDDNDFNEEWPLWKYAIKQSRTGKGDGNTKFMCNLCQVIYTGSYPRLRNHLLKNKGHGISVCTKATKANVIEMSRLEGKAAKMRDAKEAKNVPLPWSVYNDNTQSGSFSESMDETHPSSFRLPGNDANNKKRKCVDGPLVKALNMQAREMLDGEIARMFYSGGVPFNLAKNPHFINAFRMAGNLNISGYTPPGYNPHLVVVKIQARTKILSS